MRAASRQATHSRSLSKRNWIYVGLLAFITAGVVIDFVVWPEGPPNTLTWNDVPSSSPLALNRYTSELSSPQIISEGYLEVTEA